MVALLLAAAGSCDTVCLEFRTWVLPLLTEVVPPRLPSATTVCADVATPVARLEVPVA